MDSKRATKEPADARISCFATAMKPTLSNPGDYPPVANNIFQASQCHLCASCVKCHLRCHAIGRTNSTPTQMKRSLRPRLSWQGNCMDSEAG